MFCSGKKWKKLHSKRLGKHKKSKARALETFTRLGLVKVYWLCYNDEACNNTASSETVTLRSS